MERRIGLKAEPQYVIMSPEEFKNRMCDICARYDDDVEMRHQDMDGLMAQVLTTLGYGEGINIFDDTYKWYA